MGRGGGVSWFFCGGGVFKKIKKKSVSFFFWGGGGVRGRVFCGGKGFGEANAIQYKKATIYTM